MAEKHQSQLAGRLIKNPPRSGLAPNPVSHPNGGLLGLEELGSGSKDLHNLSESFQDDHREHELRRPTKKARLSYADHPDSSFVQHCAKKDSLATHYPTPKLTSEPSNASSTVNLWPFSTIHNLDAANPGSLAATVANLNQFIDESYLHRSQLAIFGVPHQTDGCEVYPIKQDAMNWSSLPDSSTIWGHNENGINQEDGHANDVSLPDDQETRELPYTDHITHDHQDAAVDFMQFVDIPEQDAEEESYSIGSLDEEDMAKLADSVDQPPRQTPPTSVMREISSISSAGTYDPTLQRSSPANNPPESTEEEELLDSDIDWTPIMDQLATQANLHPLDQSVSQPAVATVSRNPRGLQHAPFRECTLPPFTRPPFPQRLRDKSPICGLSNTTVLRTCFRLGHLIAENIHNSSHNQDAVYELYARVNYSHRNRPSSTQIPLFNAVKHDNSARMQLFQFVDLWKDTKPYVWGVLENWRPDGALNKQSGVFLSAGPPPSQFTDNNDAQHEKKMCRCICRISKAPKGESQGGGRSKRNNPEIGGWVMKVLWIEEIGWDMIEKMKAIICHE